MSISRKRSDTSSSISEDSGANASDDSSLIWEPPGDLVGKLGARHEAHPSGHLVERLLTKLSFDRFAVALVTHDQEFTFFVRRDPPEKSQERLGHRCRRTEVDARERSTTTPIVEPII